MDAARSLLAALLAVVLPCAAWGAPAAGSFVGSIIFVRGEQVVAEIPQGATEKERMILIGGDLRPKGAAVVVNPLADGTYVLRPVGSGSPSVGDRLARETETEAAARVVQENRLEGYREFLELYPKSSYRERIGREMFRLAMASDFPADGGGSIQGRLRLAETVSREVPLGKTPIVLDRFLFPGTDPEGGFRLEGLPPLEEPVTLKLRVKDPRFEMASEVEVKVPAGSGAALTVEVPVRVTPTVLVGTVLDGRGSALPGAEVWTAPHSTEVLTGDDGAYRISRRKLSTSKEGSPADEPLFGGEFEVYARRKGYGVERAAVSAQSYRENAVPPIRLPPQDPRREELPELSLDLRRNLWVSTPLR